LFEAGLVMGGDQKDASRGDGIQTLFHPTISLSPGPFLLCSSCSIRFISESGPKRSHVLPVMPRPR
jgi:hypothetical protein